jgi:hypothetical protein
LWETSSPYINRFIQPDTLIPNPANPQAFNRYSYVMNSPVNFNDPTGHMCEDPEATAARGGGNRRCDGANRPGQVSHGGGLGKLGGRNGHSNGGDNGDSDSRGISVPNPTNGEIGLLALEDSFDPANELLNPSSIFDPFNGDAKLPLCPMEEGCTSYPSYFPYELQHRFDITRINRDQLAWDFVGLGISLLGIKSLQSAIQLNPRAVDWLTYTYVGLSALPSGTPPRVDKLGLATTAVSLYPPAAVGASSFSILRDISAASYKVKVINLLPGPSAGPYCNGKYGC